MSNDVKDFDIDAFLADPVATATDYDPQAAVASQGIKTIGRAVESGPAISKAPMEGVEPESDPITDLAGSAIATRVGPKVADAIASGMKAADFKKIVGNQIGSVGSDVSKKTDAEAMKLMSQYAEEKRLQRAKDMGFNTKETYYHGTPNGEFKEFDPKATSRAYKGEIAGYFTKDKAIARGFSEGEDLPKDKVDSHVFQTHLKANNPFDYQNKQHVAALLETIPKATLQNIAKSNKRLGEPGTVPDLIQDINAGKWEALEHPKIIQAIKANGHDSMHASENGSKTLAVFQPNQIRNTNANFDPSKADSGNLAAGLGALGVSGAAAQGAQSNQPQSYAKGGMVRDSKQTSTYAKVPNIKPQGLRVSAPESLSTIESADSPVAAATDNGTPPGLDDFLSPPATNDNTVAGETNSREPAGLNEFIEPELKQEKYGTLGQMGKAALEGAAQGLVGPLAPLAETKLGLATPEDIRGREEANPITHYGSEIAGLVGPALVTGGATTGARGALAGLAKFTQAGALETLGKALPFGAGTSLASRIGGGAAKAAIDNMLIAGSDETSKMILNDPNQSAETAMANIGLAGAIGGTLGGTLGAGGALWKATFGDKASKLIEDFKGRIQEHIENPEPVQAVQSELGDYYKKITDLGDEVYGPKGLKARDIAKALPELNEKIANQSQIIYDKVDAQVKGMLDRQDLYPARLTSKLKGDLDTFSKAMSHDNLTSSDVFNATQDLKQSLQGYSKYDKFVKPVDEAYDFVRDAKSLAHDLRTSLEDTSVWGKAAERQRDINKAYSEYGGAKGPLKNFESKFTTEVNGERVIDPGKVNTYINQLGKPTAEIKQTMLKNFLEASEKYKKVIGDSHVNLGMESPIQDAPMNAVMRTLQESTTGGKLADAFIKKGLTEGGSSALGSATGAGIGGLLGGHVGAGVGAIIGHHALAPFLNSVLPAIAKSIVGSRTSATGLKEAVDYGIQVAKGESVISKGIKNVFKASSEVLPESYHPNEKDTARLDKMLKAIQVNPQGFLDKAKPASHYLPAHSSAMDQATMNGVAYLNSLRPNLDPKAPLDSKGIASSTQVAAFNNALKIAQQPMIVMDKVKKGTITGDDIKTLTAVYPNLYNRIKQKITDELVTLKNKNEMIPYTTRIGLSMFLAQPLDSSMSPLNIQSAQLQGSSQQQNSPQTSQGPQPSKGVKSSPALQKMPGMFQTPGQARQQRQLKD